jgi:hypothetical protein
MEPESGSGPEQLPEPAPGLAPPIGRETIAPRAQLEKAARAAPSFALLAAIVAAGPASRTIIAAVALVGPG